MDAIVRRDSAALRNRDRDDDVATREGEVVGDEIEEGFGGDDDSGSSGGADGAVPRPRQTMWTASFDSRVRVAMRRQMYASTPASISVVLAFAVAFGEY